MARGSRRAAREAALEALRRSDAPLAVPAGQRSEDGHVVRTVSGSPGRTYRCPGCDQEMRSEQPHVVAWPDGREDDRRHWHTACWRARDRRAPRVQRGRDSPRYG